MEPLAHPSEGGVTAYGRITRGGAKKTLELLLVVVMVMVTKGGDPLWPIKYSEARVSLA